MSLTINHLPEISEEEKAKLNETIQKSKDKIEKICGETTLNLHYKESRKEGNRELIEVKALAKTKNNTHHSESTEWNAEQATRNAMQKLEKEVLKDKNKA